MLSLPLVYYGNEISSGGHLAGEWATKNVGAVRYGIKGPKAVFLGYPASDTTAYREFNGKNMLLEGMLGKNYTCDDVAKYNVNAHIDDTYPITYLWHCKDDNIIPSELLQLIEVGASCFNHHCIGYDDT